MLLLLSAIMAMPAADMPVISPNANQPANCPATSRYEAARRGTTPQARKLGGCEAPIVVKFGVGGR
jgi:hypothetical protein